MTDTRGAKFVRGLVRTVFIACYAAFMWASIHHVAAFFENFEQGNGNSFGSYLLAGSIDITALVTTAGVMFFRKSMPKTIQIVLWGFIIGLALYSFFINWEYASHFHNTDLIMHPTGATTPVLDSHGNVHYVPVMVETTWLRYVNPALASCFTIFALIYSVVGEFFGAKAPTAGELLAKKTYLEETASVLEDIRKLEEKSKGPGAIQRLKDTANELARAGKEIADTLGKGEQETSEIPDVKASENNPKEVRSTGPLSGVSGDVSEEEEESFNTLEREAIQVSQEQLSQAVSGASKAVDDLPQTSQKSQINAAIDILKDYFPQVVAWRDWSLKSVDLSDVSRVTGVHHRTLGAMANKGTLTRLNRYPQKVLLTSVITW